MSRSGLLSIFSFSILLLFSCKQAPEGEQVEAREATQAQSEQHTPQTAQLQVNTQTSEILWEGTKPGRSHTGTLKLQKGYLQVANGQISGGEFVIDMNSINNTDQTGDDKSDLEAHLKSSDFFDTDQYPTASFVITKVEPLEGRDDANYLVTGNLTIKGITKSVSIPAQVHFTEQSVDVTTPKFTIDRTQWDITYKSGIIGTAKDRLIHDQIGLQIKLQAMP